MESLTARRAFVMTVEDFLAFTDTRPDEERWELVEGEPFLNASASRLHQLILGNLLVGVTQRQRELRATWEVLPGIGVRVSDLSLPVPDLLVRPRTHIDGSVCDDVLAVFEVLSPSTANHDLRWKRRAYAELPTLAHYVVIAQDRVEVVTYDRERGFAEHRLETRDASLPLSALGIEVPLSEIYRNIPLGE